MNKSQFIDVKDLEVYQLALALSKLAWEVYQKLDRQQRRILGEQFIKAADSVGANIVEGYARYYYLDKIRFYYTSRASLYECCSHWLDLLKCRELIDQDNFEQLKQIHKMLSIKLNNFISATYRAKQQSIR